MSRFHFNSAALTAAILVAGAAGIFQGCADHSPDSLGRFQLMAAKQGALTENAVNDSPGLLPQRDLPVFAPDSLHPPSAVDAVAIGSKAIATELWIIEAPPIPTPMKGGPPPIASCIGALTAHRNGDKPLALATKPLTVKANLTATIATVRISQGFINTLKSEAHGVYTLALPANATPTDFVLTFGNRRIRALVRSRESAGEIFKAAKLQGLPASISKAGTPLALSLGNIAPGADIAVTSEYVQPLAVSRGLVNFDLGMADGGVTWGDSGASEKANVEITLTPGMPVEKRDDIANILKNKQTGYKEFSLTRAEDFSFNFPLGAAASPKAALLTSRDSRGLFYAISIIAPTDVPATGMTLSAVGFDVIKLPEVPKGSSVLLLGRLEPDKSLQAVPTLTWNSGRSTFPLTVVTCDALPTLWARAQYDAMPATSGEARQKLALQYKLLTPETAILAVDTVRK
jgi:hypothetical protein